MLLCNSLLPPSTPGPSNLISVHIDSFAFSRVLYTSNHAVWTLFCIYFLPLLYNHIPSFGVCRWQLCSYFPLHSLSLFFLSWDQNSIIDKKGRCGFHSYFMEIYKTNFEPNASALIWNYKLANINALLRFAISKGIYQDRFAFEGLIKLCAHLAKLPTLQKYFYV